MGGLRSYKKPLSAKKRRQKNTRNRAHKELSVKESSTNKSNFHKKYNEYVTKIANKLNMHPNEASAHLGRAMETAFNGIMLAKIPYDEYYSLRDDELQSTLHPSIGSAKRSKKKGKCKSCGKSGSCNKCDKCGKMKVPLSFMRKMRPMNKRTFHLTPKALRHDNIKTNMSGYSETRICESHNGSPLKCRTMRKRY